MSAAHVLVATCQELPEVDDGDLLLPALARAGVEARVAAWDDDSVDWAGADLVLVRSTWDYTDRREEFLAWAGSCRTANPAQVLRWNSDKTYLRDLAAAGVPVVPTTFLAPGEQPPEGLSGEVVVKPTVSAGARDTLRRPAGDPALADLVRALHARGRTAMVQPYLAGVEARGETALLHLGGRRSHTARKEALLAGPDGVAPRHADGDVAQRIGPATATAQEEELARAALAAVPGGPEPLLYARVDVVPGPDGAPLLLELEVVEPSLFLDLAPQEEVDRFAAAVAAAARG